MLTLVIVDFRFTWCRCVAMFYNDKLLTNTFPLSALALNNLKPFVVIFDYDSYVVNSARNVYGT